MSRQVATTKMSSRGQIVIPEAIREELGLESGTKFVVLARGDTVVLKAITPPSKHELKALLLEAKKQVKAANIAEREIEKIVRAERAKLKKSKKMN